MSLVIMRGISGSGKSTIARELFEPHQILSSDTLRLEMYGTMNINPSSCGLMWGEFYRRLDYRCSFHIPTVVDATNLTMKSLKSVINHANRYNTKYQIVSIRPELTTSQHVLAMRRSGELVGVTFDDVVLSEQLERYNNNTVAIKTEHQEKYFEGDDHACRVKIISFMDTLHHHQVTMDTYIIGDIHGKLEKLSQLLDKIPSGASIYSVGDLIDRGEDSVGSVRKLMKDPRYKGYTYGNHDLHFIHESLGNMSCMSIERRKTHDDVNALDIGVREKFHKRLLTGSPYIVLQCNGWRDVLITHTGLSSFSPWSTNIHDTISDRVNNKDSGVAYMRTRFLQVHGHRAWEYTGDFYGDIVNVDSGCYSTEILTAFNPFTREVIHV